MKKYLLLIAVLLLFTKANSQNQEITTLILVRHAEKAIDKGGDPVLTQAGEDRAKALAKVLEEVKVDAIYSTPFRRTRLTVEPLAKKQGIDILEYNPFKLEDMIQIIQDSKGKTLLISGHSNTTPAILNMLLSEDKYRQLDESDYDNLYVVSIFANGEAKVLQLQYGNSDAPE